MNPELEAFIPLVSQVDLTDPVIARKQYAATAAARAAPDTADLEIEDRAVPADPDVPVRIYRPHQAQGVIVRLHGLPSAYIATAEFCPNRDEGITYALRLLQAGVSSELHQWPGTFHGSQAILPAEVSQRQLADLAATLRRARAE